MYGGNLHQQHAYAEARHRDFVAEAEASRRLREAGISRGSPLANAFSALRLIVGTGVVSIGERIQGTRQPAGTVFPATDQLPSVSTLNIAR